MQKTHARWFALTTLAAAAALAVACENKKPDLVPAAPPATESVAPAPTAVAPASITVHAKNYAFTGVPDTVPAGPVTFRLVNDGPAPEVHQMAVMRFKDGHTKKEFIDAMKAGKVPAWAESVGGPNVSTVPGQPSVGTVSLEPGQYTIFCFVPGPDGVPHIMKGMQKDFTVTPATGPSATMPTADVTIKLADYNFAVTPALTAGHHVLRVENGAMQDHEVVLVKLDAGKTPDDVVKWVDGMKGPPPGTFVGGVTGISQGVVNEFEMDLAAGDYALICFLPDVKDGKMHAMHGMKQLVHVS